MNIQRVRDLIQQFDFHNLFIEELGWSQPDLRRDTLLKIADVTAEYRHIAQLAGVVVIEIATVESMIPDAKTRAAIHRDIERQFYEHLLIFINQRRDPSQSVWSWIKREGGKWLPREHAYFRGQPGDLFIAKISRMVVDISELDTDGQFSLLETAQRLQNALDVERVTRKFFREFQEEHLNFTEAIGGIADERDRRWYASVLLHRLMFIWFLQKRQFLDGGNTDYLKDQLAQSRQRGAHQFYRHFLLLLFFEGFAKPPSERSPSARTLLGDIRYLNGGLFLPHSIELRYPAITVADTAFEKLFDLFSRYSWNLNDTPGGQDDEINPDVLGYIFEKYINQKAFGAYYTRTEITEYLCEQAIYRLILDQVNQTALPALKLPARHFDSVPELLTRLDAGLCRTLLFKILPQLSLLDPACGSGAFLVAAMKTLINVYSAIIGRIKFLNDPALNEWLKNIERDHPSLNYYIKKRIITHNLFGVDFMEEAMEIAKLRLFLALVASARTVEQLEPLPNIDFNILAGNSLIGLMRVNAEAFEKKLQQDMFRQTYHQVLDEKNRLIAQYRDGAGLYGDELRTLRDCIAQQKQRAQGLLNDLLLADFAALGIKFEQATWDAQKGKDGKPIKRLLTLADMEALHPFHWGFEFDVILNERGGFDAVITNPPWEIFKPQAKEFFAEHSDLVSKNKMTIKAFEKEQAKLLKEVDIRHAWLDYQSRFPHLSAYFRASSQYPQQTAVVNGKKTGSDINLYKLFVEQCYNLLRPGGQCGIVIPSGIYTDLGTTGLRNLLFNHCQIASLFSFSNEKFIFEEVHHAQKFCLLTFGKGEKTESFTAAFRINPREAISPNELWKFFNSSLEYLVIPIHLIHRLSPDSHSMMEFKSVLDIQIAEKLLRFPLLGEKISGVWNLVLTNEFHMTNDSHLFKTEPGAGRLPLYEGKMIWQFEHGYAQPRYWLDEQEAQSELLKPRLKLLKKLLEEGHLFKKISPKQIKLDYQSYRLAFRDVAASTNERCMIMTVLPPHVFCPHTMSLEKIYEDKIIDSRLILNFSSMNGKIRLFVAAIFNSFVADYLIRQKITNHLSFFFIYNSSIPRFTEKDPAFAPIVHRAAQLICTTPEFDDLAKEVGLDSHSNGVTDLEQRAQIRAELDGLIAHVYGLTEAEFAHVLTTFPLVDDAVKAAALQAYQALKNEE